MAYLIILAIISFYFTLILQALFCHIFIKFIIISRFIESKLRVELEWNFFCNVPFLSSKE